MGSLLLVLPSLVLFFSSKLSLGFAVMIFTNKDSNFHLFSYSSDMDETPLKPPISANLAIETEDPTP